MRLVKYRGIYCVYTREGKAPKRHSLGTRDPIEAQKRYAIYLSAVNSAPKPSVVLVKECLEDYYKDKPDVIPRPSIMSFFGHLLPESINKELCEAYPKQRNASVKTIHTEMGILRAGLRNAEKKKWCSAPFIWMPDNGDPRDRWLSYAEAKMLMHACDTPHLILFVLIALRTAARPGAILDLTWPQVSWDLNRIDFKKPGVAQTRKRRPIVPIADDLRYALEQAYENKAPYDQNIICWGGEGIKSIKRAFKAACIRAKLKDVTPNTLRHTAATWMAESGVPMRKISLYLGHSNVATTERIYAKHTPKYLQEAVNALAQFPLVQMNTRSVNVLATLAANDGDES